MELLDERPVWSMSGGEKLSALDGVNAEIARLKTRGLHLVAGLDDDGYASEIGAHDTARLLAARYRIDATEAHRDVRLARALSKYPTVAAALPDTSPAAVVGDPDGTDSAGACEPDGTETGDGAGEAVGGRPLHPAQAQAIVWSLERVATRVTGEHLAVAEEQLVNLAAHLSPGELRTAGKEITDLLDSDGPQPDEDKAYQRESLTLANAENGVKFRGFLANENAELLRTITHAGARPHKTLDGELDPRPREKRQADALTTALTIAAAATDTGFTPTNLRPIRRDATAPTTTAAAPTTAATEPHANADVADPGNANATSGAPTGPASTSATNAEASHTPDAPNLTAGTANSAGAGVQDPAATATYPAPAPVGAHPLASSGTAHNPATGGTATTAAATTVTAATTGTTTAVGGGSAGWVPGFGAKANITVTIDFNDLKAATADATGQLVYGDALSAAAIRRLACDATIIPLVLGSNSEPLDVGRSERLVNRAMRRALNARDKGCVVCGAPPIQCDAHHVRSWIDGGPTAINNLVLLCRRHHIDLHAGHWTITITNGTVHVSRPTWADPPHTRRAGPQPSHTHPPTASPPPTSTTRCPDPNDVPGRDGVPDSADAARVECWGEETSAVPQTSRPINHWPDDATREEAAQFAVWGDTSGSGAATQSDLSSGSVAPGQPMRFDPWGDATVSSGITDVVSVQDGRRGVRRAADALQTPEGDAAMPAELVRSPRSSGP